MRIDNKTDIPNSVVRDAIRFARPSGISPASVVVRHRNNSAYFGLGRAYPDESKVIVRISKHFDYPARLWTYQYGQLAGRRYHLGSLVEALIYLLAHELMHIKQRQCLPSRGRVWGARGIYSEIEAESYAIHKLREWRKLQ